VSLVPSLYNDVHAWHAKSVHDGLYSNCIISPDEGACARARARIDMTDKRAVVAMVISSLLLRLPVEADVL